GLQLGFCFQVCQAGQMEDTSAPALWRFVSVKNQRKRKLTNDKFMNEKPKSIWKRSLTGWRGLLLGWLILMVALAA
ncbi:MAG TPA: hypothetical protein VF492_09425, partial [Verrucomicrobiae bacterium]